MDDVEASISSIFGTGGEFNSELFQDSLSSIESPGELKKRIEYLERQLHSTHAMWSQEFQARCQLQGYVQGIQGIQAMMMRMSNQPMMAAPLALQSSPYINILSQDFDTLRRDIKAAKTELEATQTKLSIENSNLKAAKTKLEDTKSTLQATQTRLEEARSTLQTVTTHIEKKNVVLETIQVKVRDENLKLETIQARVEKETIDLRESVLELEHSKRELERAKMEHARVVGEYNSLKRDISSRKSVQAGRGRGVHVLRTNSRIELDFDVP